VREVVPGLVWIGNARDARDVAQVLANGIRAVVNLAIEEQQHPFPREMIYCRFPLLDGAGNPREMLLIAVQTVSALLLARIPTLLACSGGMSRSPVIAAAAMARAYGDSPVTWLKRITESGAHDVSPAFWNELSTTFEAS
jgi:hypothetical protein